MSVRKTAQFEIVSGKSRQDLMEALSEIPWDAEFVDLENDVRTSDGFRAGVRLVFEKVIK